jgi:hypothetical protein
MTPSARFPRTFAVALAVALIAGQALAADPVFASGFQVPTTASGAVINLPDATHRYGGCAGRATNFVDGQWFLSADCAERIDGPREKWQGGGTSAVVVNGQAYAGCRVLWHDDFPATGLWWLSAECDAPAR